HSTEVAKAADLSDADRDHVWRIFEENMHTFYQGSSLGWSPKDKKAELFHQQSRFILVRDGLHPSDDSDTGSGILAYTMFRFDEEDGDCVVYCYELQVAKTARRTGLGKVLMQCLHDIGRAWNMQKIMLTVFKINEPATAFYKSVGFEMDPFSPGYEGSESEESSSDASDEECDYVILSKKIIAMS
ncbi:acyl-CoA N-acyltransferase, partial [Dentipellis sp. KUC8613]